MRISALLGKPVYDRSGTRIGACHDVRALQTRALGRRDALTVTGLVVGKGSVGTRLGYGFSTDGPWLLEQVFGRLARSARFVAWRDVEIYADRLVVAVPVETLRHPSEIDAEEDAGQR